MTDQLKGITPRPCYDELQGIIDLYGAEKVAEMFELLN